MKANISSHHVSRSCAVTGANGYVGSHISAAFHAKGWRVAAFVHGTQPLPSYTHRQVAFDLSQPVAPETLAGIDTLIHCAYDFRPQARKDIFQTNVTGSKRLLEAARTAGVRRIIAISTISAFPGCVSLYGQAKLQIEEAAQAAGAAIVRPGLVFGHGHGGMIGRINGIVRKTPVVPLIGNGSHLQYLAHIDDLCALILQLAEREESLLPADIVTAANSQPKTFKEIIAILSAQYRPRKPLYLPIPTAIPLEVLRICRFLGLRLPFSYDNLVSLIHQNPQPDFGPITQLEIPFREFSKHTLD